jgi:hypothetical protein
LAAEQPTGVDRGVGRRDGCWDNRKRRRRGRLLRCWRKRGDRRSSVALAEEIRIVRVDRLAAGYLVERRHAVTVLTSRTISRVCALYRHG